MMNGRRVISAILGGLLITAVGYADMVPVSGVDAGSTPSAAVCSSSSLFDSPNIAVPDFWPVDSLPEADADAGQPAPSQPPLTLTNEPDSLSLCLSALMGLGVCGSSHWVRKLHFGFIPEWYHDGGPLQIGHSYAVTPDSLCTVPAYCFIQPACTAKNSLPQYRLGTIVSPRRKSQFRPIVLASRGPPITS